MASRVAARLLTGPLAFLIGGLIEVGGLLLVTLRERARRWAADAPTCRSRPRGS